MRPLILFGLLTLSLLPFASAQTEGCLQSNPCNLDVDVDANGVADISQTNFTSGDWYTLSVYNDDGVEHTVALSGHGVSLKVPAYGLVDSPPFQFGAAGSYTLSDSPSGDNAPIKVVAGDVVDYENGKTSAGAKGGIPGPEPALLLVALASLVLVKRR